MTLQEIQYKAQGIIHKWRDDDSAPYVEFVEELAHMTVPEPSKDLEEAAGDYASDSIGFIDMTAYRAFIAGAKWQKEQDQETIKLSEINPFLAGVNYQKEQMTKEAVEGEVVINDYFTGGYKEIEFEMPDELKVGDKVRVIVLKKED